MVGSYKPRNNKSIQKLPAYGTQLSTANHYSTKAGGVIKMLLQKEMLTLMVLLEVSENQFEINRTLFYVDFKSLNYKIHI